MPKKITLHKTKNIYDFGPILMPLVPDFTMTFVQTVLEWCKVVPVEDDGKFWKVWLVKKNKKAVGICGLYSLNKKTDELWLGWFGIVPEFRNKGVGVDVMAHLYKQAKKVGCKKMFSYVDKQGAPLSFYGREGFEVIGTVKDYIRSNFNVSKDSFEDIDDFVIMKKI